MKKKMKEMTEFHNDSGYGDKQIKLEEDSYDQFPYDCMIQIKSMLNSFRNDEQSFKLIIDDAIKNWKRQDQKLLAEFLVSIIFGELDERIYESHHIHENNFCNIAKLKYVIKADIKYLSEQDLISKFTSFSFTILLIERLTKLQESREFILNMMEKIYSDIDFDVLENINLEELASEVTKQNNIDSETQFSSTLDEFFSKEYNHFDEKFRRSSSILITKKNSRKPRFSFVSKQPLSVRARTFERKGNQHIFEKVYHRNSSRHKNNNNKTLLDSIRDSPIKLNFKSKSTKSLKTVEYCKDVMTKILKGLFSNYKRLPISIRIICKFLFDELIKIPSTLEQNTKSRALGILSDTIYSNWLITPLFIEPTSFGLIKNNDKNMLIKVLLDFSKIIAHIIKGIHIYGPHMLTWMCIFSDYIEKNSLDGEKYINAIIDVKIPKCKQSENESLIDLMITSSGIIYKLFRVYSLNNKKLQSNSLKNAIGSLEFYESSDQIFTKFIENCRAKYKVRIGDIKDIEINEKAIEELKISKQENKQLRRTVIEKRSKKKQESKSEFIQQIDHLDVFDNSSEYESISVILHEKYILFTSQNTGNIEIGIKKLLEKCIKQIKQLNKTLKNNLKTLDQNSIKETKLQIQSNTFDKLVIGFLFECPDMSKSYNRYNPCNDIEGVFEAMIRECDNDAQRTNLLTLLTILKAMKLSKGKIENLLK